MSALIPNQQQLTACHLCGGRLRAVVGYPISVQVTSDCRPWRGESTLACCSSCGVIQKPVSALWLEEVGQIYKRYVVYEQGDGAEQVSFDAATGGAMARSKRIVSWLDAQQRLRDTGALLDIGCGNGGFLRAFGSLHYRWEMTGLELDNRNKLTVESIPGVKCLHVGPIETLDRKFDLAVMVHALEHIPEPTAFLRRVAGKLNPGGLLLLQVPDLQTSPFDLLIADHCSHFSAAALKSVVRSAGFMVHCLDTSCVAKELTLLAEAVPSEHPSQEMQSMTCDADERTAIQHVSWMRKVLQQGRLLSAPMGIFGTSISATWLASALADGVTFFVDEDLNRSGRKHLGKPVFSPAEAPSNVDILMPMRNEVASAIAARLAPHRLRLIIPPVP